jgi:hypothetical protein
MTGPDVFDEIRRLSEPYWQTRSNEIHLPMAIQYAHALLRAHPEADAGIVLPAITMHDNGYLNVPPETRLSGLSGSPKGWDPNITRLHEIEGVKIAHDILGTLNYDSHRRDAIAKIIDGHDSIKTAHSLEDALVKDADKLWRNTVISIQITRYWHNRAVPEYLDYLEQSLDGWMLTDYAKALARQQQHTSRAASARGELR